MIPYSILSFQIEAERIDLLLKKVRSYFVAAFPTATFSFEEDC